MGDWAGQGIWWVMDYSYLVSLFWASFSYEKGSHSVAENVLNPVKPTVDSVINALTWTLDREPEMAFVALDSGQSKRREIYPEYKAFRERDPEYHACYSNGLQDLKHNFSDVVQVVAAPGWEADDVMATIARQAVEAGKKCVLMSQDKDLNQCLVKGSVNKQVRVRDELGRPDWGFFTEEMAVNAWGKLRRDQFIDYQILTGDDCDNIPGCDGIGEKKAVRFLKQYDSIAKMKEVVDDIPGADGKKLKAFFSDLEPVTRKLITLRTDVDFQNVEL